jgi:nitrogen regulatory protein PII
MKTEILKLITIICEPVLVSSLIEKIQELGATGFTITEVKGEGSGEKSSGEVPNEKTKIEVISDYKVAENIMTEVSRSYFENYSVIVYATDVHVIRKEKF